MGFDNILEKYRSISFSERDKGYRFERLMQSYLLTDPQYAFRLKRVWLWNEFPYKKDFGGKDTGIDLVGLTTEGDYWAIQCKCLQEGTPIDKPSVDSFLSTSSREFRDENVRLTAFSNRIWISTTNNWGTNAEESIKNQNPPVTRINLYNLREAPVKWENIEKGITGEGSRITGRNLLQHQTDALEKAHAYFKTEHRGKLIMACGTGKTFTSLRIAENETGGKGFILFLVPSISLLGQTLREWTAYSTEPINAICICSDPEVSRKKTKNEDTDHFSVVDLALPASTRVGNIIHQFRHIRDTGNFGMTVVFSTYQSIDVISNAQKELKKEYPEFLQFDLIICDEAHRTTGVSLAGEEESAFVKVHDNEFIKGKKRLYMTATPRLYGEEAKKKAAESDAVLCSMDDPELYGEEIYRIGFGDAVEKDLLSDYKVLILTMNDSDIPAAIREMVNDKDHEIDSDDASKLIGCINALSKQIIGDEGTIKSSDPEPMRRAVAFCQSIVVSKKITGVFNSASDVYTSSLPHIVKDEMVSVSSRHIDGTMSAPTRDELLGWLKSDTRNHESRILTNVRCLSEGVDVPSLDAVMFLSARNSQVDVVQSVGRVMRKSPGKKYGYIIIPIIVPSNVEAHQALDDNERYKVVWTVLNALRAHDDRFNAIVNKIELNKKRPVQILVGRSKHTFNEEGNSRSDECESASEVNKEISRQLAIQFEQLQSVVFARMVKKVGDRRYWEQWAKNVAEIAERQMVRINRLINEDMTHRDAFTLFLGGLQKNINPSITQTEAVEMLSQHIITRPVFEALFEGDSFVKNNPISVSMQSLLDLLEAQAIEKDTVTLQNFYESVKKRASGIDNAEGKQRIIIELYDKFFKAAFPKMVEKLGIVYTPVEIVDFILHSVNDVLKKEFNRSIGDENIHILDPFTGTGTFITRLLQSGLISKEDMPRKYKYEIHANEIVLLAYYIAAVNIENAYHDALSETDYRSFDGICLTDTFQLGETDGSAELFSELFKKNSERVVKQKNAPLMVIMGNPPYSVGQRSANDNAQNQSYPKLDAKISKTYAKESSAGLNKSLYDSYIKAYRWSADRLDKNGGIIAFVSNGAWLDGNSTDGLRKCLEKEFTSIYVLNLRGNQRTSGELSRKEGGKIFGSGSRTPIAITLLVKNPAVKTERATIYYNDIGDYLSREEKLAIIKKYRSIGNSEMRWVYLSPNEHSDWIIQRNRLFETFIPLEPDKKFDIKTQSIFIIQGPGILSSRDVWVYNFSKVKVTNNMTRMIDFYNEQQEGFRKARLSEPNLTVEDFINTDSSKISWTWDLKKEILKGIPHLYNLHSSRIGAYRPFCLQRVYYDKSFIERPGLSLKFFPSHLYDNLIISISGIGSTKWFSVLVTNKLTCYDFLEKTQCFPLYYYEERPRQIPGLFDAMDDNRDYIRRDGVSDFILERAQRMYGKTVTKEAIFYYVYGFLHSPEYRKTFSTDLKKSLPRLPLVEKASDFWEFSKAGRALSELHINYESVPAYEDVIVTGAESCFYKVDKMRFPRKDQKDTIIYNSNITIDNIPDKAYEYVVNGKSAIEWIMERYQITVHKESGIRNDPNDWAREIGKPRYILDLLLSIINVSIQTVDIVNGLPKLKFG